MLSPSATLRACPECNQNGGGLACIIVLASHEPAEGIDACNFFDKIKVFVSSNYPCDSIIYHDSCVDYVSWSYASFAIASSKFHHLPNFGRTNSKEKGDAPLLRL